MKNLILLFALAVVVINPATSFSANEQFRSVASGNWNSTLTWEMSTNGGGSWFAATSTPHDTSGATRLRSPNVVTVTANITSNQLTLDSNATLVINSGVILTIIAGTGDDMTVLKGSIVNGPGTVRTQGTIELNLRAGSAFNAPLNVNTGTTFAWDGSSPYDGSLFGDVTIDAGATLNGGTVSGLSLLIGGNITNNGNLTATSTGAAMFITGPSFINNGTSSATNIYLNGATSLSGSGTFSSINTYINNTVTLAGNVTYSPTSGIRIQIGGTLNPNGNTFTLASGTLQVETGGTVTASGTVRTQNAVTINVQTGSAFGAALNVNTGTAITHNTVASSPASFLGAVTIDAGATLNGGNTSGRTTQLFGNVTNNGVLTTGSVGGTVRIKGASFSNSGSVTAASFYFDTTTSVSGTGTYTSSSMYVSLNGNVTCQNEITYSPTSQLVIVTGGVLNPNGNIVTFSSGTLVLQNAATISSPGTLRTQNTVALNIGGTAAFNAALIVNTGNTTSNNGTGIVASLYGNTTIDAGATLNGGNVSGRKLQYFGNVTNNGTLIASSTGGQNRMRGASFVNNGTVDNYSFWFDTTTSLSGTGNWTTTANINTNGNVTLLSNHQMHSVSISTGGVFNISNRTIKLTASNPITQNGTFTQTNAMVEYNGSALQTVSTANITYNRLRINNAAGAALAGNVTVNDSLIVLLGDLDLSGRVLTISPTGVLTETSGNTVKGSTGYITTTRSINAPSALNVGGLGAVLTTAANLGSTEIRRGHTVQSGLNGGTSIARYFDITPTNNDGLDASMIFNYDDTELNGKPESTLKLFKSTNTGTNWFLAGGSPNAATNSISLSKINSFSRWSADSSSVSMVLNVAIEGFYNQITNRLNMRDTVRAYLRNVSSPYAIVDSSKALLDSVNFVAAFNFPNAGNGTYYIQVKHRNSIETWSRIGGEPYTVGNTLSFNFISSAAKAYGSNQILVDSSPLRFGIYSGDVNQDGTVDATDVSEIDNDAFSFLGGYIVTDINGDRFVDASDYSIADNNAANFVSAVRP